MGGKPKQHKISHERLLSLVLYDRTSGVFTLIKPTSDKDRSRAVGQNLGSPDAYGYLSVRLDGENIKLHRLAWFYGYGKWPTLEIDHRDNDPSNNAFINLREASTKQNCCNTKPHRDNAIGYKGVSKRPNGFRSVIHVSGKQIYLGRYETPEAAHEAYVEAARKYFGEFARAS